MGILKASSDVGAIASLVTSVLSIVSCMLVIWFIVDYRKKKKSYHLELVGRLLLCDVGICLTIVLFYIMDIVLERTQMPDFCNLFLPLVSYFFLTSYAWTVMLALRFRMSHDRNASGELKPLLPFHVIWLVPLGLVLVLIIAAYSAGHVTKVVEGDDDDSKQACTFDHDHMAGIVLDLTIVQVPNLLTILLNVYIYACGLAALNNAPHSVLARQMRKAGGYLAILIIVWVPNLVYNMLSIIDTSHKSYDSLLDLAVLLVSLQVQLMSCSVRLLLILMVS
ncbi:hypothetical protein EON63_03100 [archaeon]|nr:MAG: hypothetical protein EON63_03100 [archaeon]